MEKGLSQADVAHAIGIAPGTVRSCEKLNNVTLTVTLLEILDALDLEISVYPKEVKRGQRNS
jgi:DNA-binding XRE family transcriptional regulator